MESQTETGGYIRGLWGILRLPQIWDSFVGVPILRPVVFWGAYCGPYVVKLPGVVKLQALLGISTLHKLLGLFELVWFRDLGYTLGGPPTQ